MAYGFLIDGILDLFFVAVTISLKGQSSMSKKALWNKVFFECCLKYHACDK
jgi:hypothetical protein